MEGEGRREGREREREEGKREPQWPFDQHFGE